MKNVNVRYLAGQPIENKKPLQPYDNIICEFLAELSRKLQRDKEALQYPDILSFAFFCRKANIKRMKMEFEDGRFRMGKGIVLHIAPSNVPINFAFSYVFGLLAGNANIVRVSSTKKFSQTDIVCRVLNELLEDERFQVIKEKTAIVSYERNKETTDALSLMSNARVIWGGNATIEEIRRSPISSRCTEITFADRFSFGIIGAQSVLEASNDEVRKLAENFYNDTYLMDQNACSTPHLIIWDANNCEKVEQAKKRFWENVYIIAQKYDLADIKVSDKYVMACEYAVSFPEIEQLYKHDNLLYVCKLKSMPQNMTHLRGKFGLFFEYELKDINELVGTINESVQTCVYYGIDKEILKKFIIDNGITGIDRIVPFGESLNIGTFWDGYNIISDLSRIINI